MTDPEEEISDKYRGREELMEGVEEGTDSDSEDENLADQREAELRSKVKDIRKQLEGNDLYYDGHIKLIAALRELFELEEARKARQKMSKVYPLTPELWLEWIRDEQKVCTTNDERQFIVELFECAVKDYTCVQLWVEFVMFMLGSGDMAATRAVGERALTSVGTHVAEGVLVWQVVLLVEKQIYAALQKPGVIHSEEEMKEQEKELCRIQGLCRRQMRVPLLNSDADSLLTEASQYFEGEIEPQMKEDLKKTQKKLNEKIPYEDELLRTERDADKLAAYRRYITHTKETDNPAAVQSLYERAVTDHCLDAGLWEEYVRFVMRQFHGLDYVVLPVCERSQRNCPWSATLCELHITALQMFATEGEESVSTRIKGALEKGLGCGIQSGSEVTRMWMAYLIYLRRQIIWDQPHDTQLHALREAGHQAISMIDKYFGDEGDIDSEIPRFLARIEAEYARDQERTREIWNNIIMKRNNNFKNGNLWLEFINLERSYGSEKHCRKLYRRALERVWDWVEVIGSSYLRFEQEAGTVESMQDFTKRYEDRLAIVSKKRAEDAAKLEAERQLEAEINLAKKQKGKQNKREWNKSSKEKNTSQSEESGVFKIPLPVTRTDKASRLHVATNASPKSSNTSSIKNSTRIESKIVTPPPGYTDDKMPPPGYKNDATPYPMSYERSKPLSGIKNTVPPPPGFKDDEPTLEFKGGVPPPPGYKNDSALTHGFKDNGTPSLSREDPAAPPPGFEVEEPSLSGAIVREAKESEGEPPAKKMRIEEQYGVLTEQDSKDELCTVFISNLDYSTGNDEIIPIFNGCGEIVSFRLVKDYKCRSKGFGYLVFKTREAAVKSLDLDRTPINGRPVFVSPYDPDGHANKFKYSTGLEKEKLFVRGLPFSMTENDVREAFQPHGKIKNMRLVTYRNGHSKGSCYIEYYDPETAEKVQQAMDGKELGNKVISVLVSDPSMKKSFTTKASSPREGISCSAITDPAASNKDTSTLSAGTLGGGNKGKKAVGTRGKGMFSLMPRTVLRAQATSPAGASETTITESQSKKMSNKDFRNLLLKK